MKRLLLISYYYPPLAGPGVFRPLRLSKYLPRNGWNVDVLSVHEGVRVLKDPELATRDVPPDVEVIRTRSIEPRDFQLVLYRLRLKGLARRIQSWLTLPDDRRGWVPFAVRRGRSLAKERPFDAVMSTSAPYSAHLVGRGLRRSCRVPWVADFRDEWTRNPYLSYPTRWHRRWNENAERSVLREADRVVCVSQPWLDGLRERVPDEPDAKFRVMPNGYDAEHFPAGPSPRPDRFRVVYTGSFYGPRSPRVFLEAVRCVVERGTVPAADLEVVLVGHTGEAHDLHAPEGVPVRIVEQRPYFESLDYLRRAAVLLLVVPPEGGAGNHTGKLFPYLASGRPILVLAPEPNVAADLVREARSGTVAPTDDSAAVARALERMHAAWKEGRPAERAPAVVARYEAQAQARAWAHLLNELVGAGETSPREATVRAGGH